MNLRHPNVHRPWSQWSEDQTLHVVSIYINPFRYRSRRELFNNFVDHMERTPNVRLIVVEVAFGKRPFEVTEPSNPNHLQLRSTDALWLKENAITLGVRYRIPTDALYIAYADGDFHFTRHDWALEAIHQLQHAPVVQLFSSYAHMSIDHRPIEMKPSFAYVLNNYAAKAKASVASGGDGTGGGVTYQPGPTAVGDYHHRPPGPTALPKTAQTISGVRMPMRVRELIAPGATGGAWAYRYDEFWAMGGLLDTCILGSGDWHMAFGMCGEIPYDHPETQAFKMAAGSEVTKSHPGYGSSIVQWQERAFEVTRGKVGYVNQHAIHSWHGPYNNRSYGTRPQILLNHEFNPYTDLVRDNQGLWKWRGNKPKLEMDVSKYFTSRNEDSTEMGSEIPML